jgi:hypothetical protein
MSEDHGHAQSGMDFGLMQVGIVVLRLRPGREFTLDEVTTRHMPAVKAWVYRVMSRIKVMGMDPVVESDSFSMFQRNDSLIIRFTVTLGWEDDFLCYAESFATDPAINPRHMAAALLEQRKKPMVH